MVKQKVCSKKADDDKSYKSQAKRICVLLDSVDADRKALHLVHHNIAESTCNFRANLIINIWLG